MQRTRARRTKSLNVQATLKVIASLILTITGALSLWGQHLLDQMPGAIMALVLPLGVVLLCWLAWVVRSRRRRAAGWETAIDPKFVRARAIGLAGLLALCFDFALALDRLGDRPHRTFLLGSFFAAWVAIGIAGLLFCGICLVGGGKR